MLRAKSQSNEQWTPADRRLVRRVARRMVGAGLWRDADMAGFRPGTFLQIFCPDRAEARYEFGRAPDGRYILIDRQNRAVSFHSSLATALDAVACIPAERTKPHP